MTNPKQDQQRPQSTSNSTDSSARAPNDAGRADGGRYADGIQGEGNYDAAREYDDAQRAFVESGKVEQAAQEAAPKSPDEERDMAEAEREGRSRAKADK